MQQDGQLKKNTNINIECSCIQYSVALDALISLQKRVATKEANHQFRRLIKFWHCGAWIFMYNQHFKKTRRTFGLVVAGADSAADMVALLKKLLNKHSGNISRCSSNTHGSGHLCYLLALVTLTRRHGLCVNVLTFTLTRSYQDNEVAGLGISHTSFKTNNTQGQKEALHTNTSFVYFSV
jgi:hypothetical protein